MGGIPFELGSDSDDSPAHLLGGVEPARRSLWALLALAIGFTLAREWSVAPAAMWFAGCEALLAAALLTHARVCRAILFVAVILAGAGWFTIRFSEPPPHRLDQRLASIDATPNPIITLTGLVNEPPRLSHPRTGALGSLARSPASWTFPLAATTLETGAGPVPVSGIVRVAIPAAQGRTLADLAAGTPLRLTGRFRPYEPPLNPGEPNRRLLALQDGVVGRVAVPSIQLVDTPALHEAAPIAQTRPRAIAWLRARASHALDLDAADAPSPGHGLLAAMLLGERDAALDDVDAAFRRVGLVHLVAISGFNLAVLASVAMFLVRLAGDRGRFEPYAVAAIVAVYLVIVPAEAPVLRAGVTVLVFLLAEALGRRYDRLTLLGWTACALLVWRPLDLWSLGFQLSFGIVGALLWLAQRAEGRLFGVPLRGVVSVNLPIGHRPSPVGRLLSPGVRWLADSLKTAASASLLAWAVATPVVLVHTGLLSPVAPLTSLLALPLTVLTLWAGYIALAVGFVWPAVGAALGSVAVSLADALASMVVALDAFPGASFTLPPVSAWWGGAAIGVVLYWFRWGHLRDRRAWALTLVVLAWFAGESYLHSRTAPGVPLRIDTLAVGDGTCHLVRSGSEAMLWDAGSSHPGLGLRDLPRALHHLGAVRVRTALVTHANTDHFLCLPDLVAPLGIERVYVTRALLDEAAHNAHAGAAALIRELGARSVVVLPLGAGESISLGSTACEILSPRVDAAYAEANDTSLVGLFRVRTTQGERRLLLTGDIGPAAIADLRGAYTGLTVDVMEVPHHGSAKPESMAFVQALSPRIVLQSTGPQRLDDRRWDRARAGRDWLVTARDGAAWVEFLDSGRLRAGTLRPRPSP